MWLITTPDCSVPELIVAKSRAPFDNVEWLQQTGPFRQEQHPGSCDNLHCRAELSTPPDNARSPRQVLLSQVKRGPSHNEQESSRDAALPLFRNGRSRRRFVLFERAHWQMPPENPDRLVASRQPCRNTRLPGLPAPCREARYR